MTVLVRHGIEA